MAALLKKHHCFRLYLLTFSSSAIYRNELFASVVRRLDCIVLKCNRIPLHGIIPVGRHPSVSDNYINDQLDFF